MRVYSFSVKASFSGVIALQFKSVFLLCVFLHNAANALNVFGQHEHQHVPVRRTVMVGFSNADAKQTNRLPVEFCPIRAHSFVR